MSVVARSVRSFAVAVVLLGASVALVGCSGRPALFPNTDKSLDRTAAQFSADAAKRNYPTDAPRGGETIGRAQVGYTMNVLEVANLSDEDWNDVEIWVNGEFVVFVPRIPSGAENLRALNFQMLYNNKGDHFPLNNNKVLVKKVEVRKDGKLYEITSGVAL